VTAQDVAVAQRSVTDVTPLRVCHAMSRLCARDTRDMSRDVTVGGDAATMEERHCPNWRRNGRRAIVRGSGESALPPFPHAFPTCGRGLSNGDQSGDR
jgi:hypothetical protein